MNNTKTIKVNYIIEAKKYKERLYIALKAAKICVFEVDLAHQLYTFFENAEDIFGVSGDVILKDVQPYSKLSPSEYQKAVTEYFSHPDDAQVIDEAFQCIFNGKSTTYEARMRAGGSDFIWCKIDVTPINENNIPVKMIGVITDITSMKTKTDTLEKAVKLDNFTGLYNKNHTIDLIVKSLYRNSTQRHALILIDIDNFKKFNDTYGHALGDNIIKLVADTLNRSFRKTDIIGRFGGDEFILLILDIPNIEWLSQKLQQLIKCEGDSYSCTNSIGVSIFPEDATEFDLLFKKADKALYQSKFVKGTYTFFSDFNT
ncbi:sensor domain-containing diguanylate cyclase [Rubeoparvulum massiliense]|uniref:sensor domain-containing diguanylate cyclase n=1 Tax=Rubeoparvulum massiliense TaxID=1631346 RepID=UPI000A705F8A|nr:sensor domain-containing diguanylate cyclase [Rubeoparvulum massiliense]